MSENILEKDKNGILLDLKVIPNSSQFELKEVNTWRGELKVAVSSPAKKGKANKELIDKLETILGKSVEIVSGSTSRQKKIRINEATEKEVADKLDI